MKQKKFHPGNDVNHQDLDIKIAHMVTETETLTST